MQLECHKKHLVNMSLKKWNKKVISRKNLSFCHWHCSWFCKSVSTKFLSSVKRWSKLHLSKLKKLNILVLLEEKIPIPLFILVYSSLSWEIPLEGWLIFMYFVNSGLPILIIKSRLKKFLILFGTWEILLDKKLKNCWPSKMIYQSFTGCDIIGACFHKILKVSLLSSR